jgi:hypothetical protein
VKTVVWVQVVSLDMEAVSIPRVVRVVVAKARPPIRRKRRRRRRLQHVKWRVISMNWKSI